MNQSDLGITGTNKSLRQTVLNTEQTIPYDSLFRDDLFDETCRSVQSGNEVRIMWDISP